MEGGENKSSSAEGGVVGFLAGVVVGDGVERTAPSDCGGGVVGTTVPGDCDVGKCSSVHVGGVSLTGR